MNDLSTQQHTQRLRIYIGESDRWRGKPLYTELLTTLRGLGVAGATVVRGVAGFGAHSRIHTSAIEVLSQDLPLIIEVIDSAEKIAAALEKINPMIREGLITVDEVHIVKYTHRFLSPLPVDRLVTEVMTRDVISISADAKLAEIWTTMLDNHLKALPVVDSHNKVVGIITDEDLLVRAGLNQRLSVAIRLSPEVVQDELRTLQKAEISAKEVMTSPVETIQIGENLGSATAKMIKTGLKRLPVVDEQGRLVGMLSRLDILHQVKPETSGKKLVSPPPGFMRTVGEAMVPEVPVVSQDETVGAIVEKFIEFDTHRLVVVDEEGRAIGLISDSDVVTRIQSDSQKGILQAIRKLGQPPVGKETARDLMSPRVLSAPVDTPVVDAVNLMLQKGRKWLVVVDEHEHPIGLIDRQKLLENILALTK